MHPPEFPKPSTPAADSSSTAPTDSNSNGPTPFHLEQQPALHVAAPTVPLPPPPPHSPPVYSMPRYQLAQFQKALEDVNAILARSEIERKTETKKKALPPPRPPRKAAGHYWDDPSLAEWPENDFRLFCGNLGNEVDDDVLSRAFAKFPSFMMARVARDKRTGKTKGCGFVSFLDRGDLAGAIKDMNGKYVGYRPIKLRKKSCGKT